VGAIAVVIASAAVASGEPAPVRLRLEREPPPRHLRMRPRVAATPSAAQGADVGGSPATPTPAATPGALAVVASEADGDDGAAIRDLRKPISVRFSLGYVVDGTALTGRPTRSGDEVRPYDFALLRAYALGDGSLSTRGVLLPSLSTFINGRFWLTRPSVAFNPDSFAPREQVVPPPIATWFDRSGYEPRSAWAEVSDFLPDKRFAPLRVRAGEIYVYGPWVLHMYGLLAAWEGKLIRASAYGGSRVPDYTGFRFSDDQDRAGIAGTSLRVDLRALRRPIPFAISGEWLAFTAAGAASDTASRHTKIQLDWRPRQDIALIGHARTLDGRLANEHVQLRTRYKQVTNVVVDVTHRRDTDWRWDPSVTNPDPLQARRYLDLGPVLPQLLVSGRAGTLIAENVDVLVRGALSNDLVDDDLARNTYAASFGELGAGLEVRLRRTVGLGLSGLTRQTRRYAQVSNQIPDIPGRTDPLPAEYGPELGERGFTEGGASVRMSLGARRFSALAEAYARRTRYSLVYCRASLDDAACMDDTQTGIKTTDIRAGGRVTIDAWMGPQLRLFASYEFSSRLDLAPEISGYKSVRLVMEGMY
jgi:hypothetical protein